MNEIINTTYNSTRYDSHDCTDIRWIGEQLKKIADVLYYGYESISLLQDIGRRLRFIGDSHNDSNNAMVAGIVELYLHLRLP